MQRQMGIEQAAECEQREWKRTEIGFKKKVNRHGNSTSGLTARVNNSVKRSEII